MACSRICGGPSGRFSSRHGLLPVFLLVAACASAAPASAPPAPSVNGASTASPTVAASPSAATPSASTAPPCPNPYDGGSCLGTLSAGTYRTTVFELPITYTVPDGWQNFEDLPGNFLLIPPGEDLGGVDAGTADYVGVGLHAVPASRDCSTEAKAIQPESGIAETPVAIAAELRDRPGLVVTEPREVEIGGLTGVVVDVRVDPTWTGTCFYSAGAPGVPLLKGLPPSNFDHAISPGIAIRLYLLANGDTTLQIEIQVVDLESLPELAAIAEGFRFAE